MVDKNIKNGGVIYMNNTKVKISIIVPIYNAEMYLEKCINSIRVQSYKNLQIILINDGSTDNSLEICKKLGSEDCRIEVYSIENSGSVFARKIGLKKADGDYIGFVDADDYIEPDMYELLSKILMDTDADFVHCGYVKEKNGKKDIIFNFNEMIFDMDNLSCKIEFIDKYILGQKNNQSISYSLWSKLYKRDLIQKCFMSLPNEQQYGEDLLCLCKCILESRRIVLKKIAMYHYMIRKNTLSHLNYDEYMLKEIGMWHFLIKLFEEYKQLDIIKQELYTFLNKRMLNVILSNAKGKINIPTFYYKGIDKIIGKKIVLFGAGKVGQDYYWQISKITNCEIVAWIDSNYNKIHLDCIKLIDVKDIMSISFEIIIIAVKDRNSGKEMKDKLISLGVEKEKIKWEDPGCYF